MAVTQYLALLRGINVGGNNIIKMTELRKCFEDLGFDNVATYIQSGNVLFYSNEKDITKLTDLIEPALRGRFAYNSRIVVLTHSQLDKIVKEAPIGFGIEPNKYRYDVLFLKSPLTSDEAMRHIIAKKGVDNVSAGENVFYWSRLISESSQSYLTKIITHPIYQNITIRNWNTTTKLLALMDDRNTQNINNKAEFN